MTGSDSPQVVFVLGRWARGGTELQALALVSELCNRGLRVTLVVVEGHPPPEAGAVPTICLGATRGPLAPLTLARAAIRLRRYLRRAQPIAVHSALARGYVVAAYATGKQSKVRRVAWRRNEGVHLRGKGALALAIERWAGRRTDVVVANSSSVRAYWTTVFRDEVEICVVPNFIAGRFFDAPPVREVAGRDPDLPVLVSVGALKPVKAHEVIISACSILASMGHATELVLVGDGPRRAELEAQAMAQGVQLSVSGVVPDVVPWLTRGTVYVHAASSEGVSNAVIEAMAAGLPAVVPEIPGMRELVGDAALLYPSGSAEILADTLVQLLTAPETRAALGREGQMRMLDRRSDRLVDDYIAIYGLEDLCAG